MSGNDSAHDDPAAPHPAPGLPEVHDEAGDTPLWVPIVGAALLVLGAIWAIAEITSHGDDAAAAVSDGGVADGEVADGETAGDAGTAGAPGPN